MPTSMLVTEYAGGDDFATFAKQALYVALCQCFGQTADIEIGAFYAFVARPGNRDLKQREGSA